MRPAVLILAASLAIAAAAPGGKPNVLFILTDDQAVDTIAAAGAWDAAGSSTRTPRMDSLYQNGTSFANAYNAGAWHGAVCVASRSMLHSGRFLWHARRAERTRFREMIDQGRFWSQRMKAAGYTTFMSGKWHVEAPAERLFDRLVHPRPGMPGTVKRSYQRPIEGRPDPWSPTDPSLGGYWEGGRHWSEVLADDAVDFLREAATGTRPFFMYLAFNAPHDPRQAPAEFLAMHPMESVGLPENFQPLQEHLDAMGLGPASLKGMRDEALAPFPRTRFAIQTHRREYKALVSHLDAQIGRILDALDAAGLSEQTHVILTSDHGLALGRHGLMGKQNLYEHSMRVPLVIRGPGIPKGRSIPSRVYMQDAMATTLDLAGADRDGIDFHSLIPRIHDPSAAGHGPIYGAFGERFQRAVIDGRHKMILYPADKTVLLFDLEADPLEMKDLSKEPAMPGIARSLFRKLMELRTRHGDPYDPSADFPSLAREARPSESREKSTDPENADRQ